MRKLSCQCLFFRNGTGQFYNFECSIQEICGRSLTVISLNKIKSSRAERKERIEGERALGSGGAVASRAKGPDPERQELSRTRYAVSSPLFAPRIPCDERPPVCIMLLLQNVDFVNSQSATPSLSLPLNPADCFRIFGAHVSSWNKVLKQYSSDHCRI